MGAGAEDNCSILHALLEHWGDSRFAAVLRGQPLRVREAVIAMLDYGWRYPGWTPTRVSDHVSAGQAPEDSNFTAVSLSMKRQRAVEQVQYNERRTKYIRLKYERTYLVIGPHELTRRHERSETEQGKYHGQTRAGRRES
jgi:hypothetical protein